MGSRVGDVSPGTPHSRDKSGCGLWRVCRSRLVVRPQDPSARQAVGAVRVLGAEDRVRGELGCACGGIQLGDL